MTSDDNLTQAIGRRIALPGHFAEPVVVDGLDDFGDVLMLRVRTARGEPKDEPVSRAELLAALRTTPAGGPEALADPEAQFLTVESARIRLAYAFDPHFAVSLSGIEALPHQLAAVYETMLPQARLRFLLADDPGAGKTIMAGLLFKELRLRGAVERALILAPAPLALQWQDEMRSKFDELFELVDSHSSREQLGGSPWSRFPLCVASMDFAKQEHIANDLLRERWDLVIIDEAHKVSMPELDAPTQRFRLARELAERTERLLLLTATPHQGNPAQFANLMSLLDEHVFRDDRAVRKLLQQESSPWFLRRMKEDLRDFEGRKLFVERHAYSEEFHLNAKEFALYEAVTAYINTFLPRQRGKRKQSAALARMVFQRRLASSLRAIRISLERRHERVQGLVDELRGLPEAERVQRLRELADLRVPDPEAEEDDQTEAIFEAVEETILVERYEQLVEEAKTLTQLVKQARDVERQGEENESKLQKLFACLERSEFHELKEVGGKLLIFTEQRATLEYLREHLERKGYRCVEIHGGMDAVSRKEAQRQFRSPETQICIATDAAGEGINLQFCHLMINYDMPWNPNRLEQRMGRIHRFGQQREVSVFNFVAVAGPKGPDAQPVVEGRILKTLLDKLDRIRDAIGDRVFDVIGLLLRQNGVNLEDALREATYNPRVLQDYTDQIEKITPERLKQYEDATGIALARRTVDLARVRGVSFASEEKRLMPEFVEDFFLRASERVGLRVQRRSNPLLLRIEHVPQKFTARNLAAVRTRGEPARSYLKATFRKSELKKAENVDGELLSPGHSLYASVDEVLGLDLRAVVGRAARYVDPYTKAPYRVHFFEVEIEGESLGDPSQPPRTVPIDARLVAVHEDLDGALREVPADVLHDLTPVAPTGGPPPDEGLSAPDAAALRRVEGWVRVRLQHPRVQERRNERSREVEVRRRFLEDAFKASLAAAQRKQMDLHARVMQGEKDARIARDDAARRHQDIETQREYRLRTLDHLAIVRAGRVAHLASALVSPPPAEVGAAMANDPEVEAFAVQFVLRHEDSRGCEVEEVWKLNDGCGFDLRSVAPPDAHGVRTVRRIEVKGRAADVGEVHLTPNEWRKAERLGDTYWLYVVWGCKTGAPRLKMIQNPFVQLGGAAQKIETVHGYRLPADALAGAPGEEWRG